MCQIISVVNNWRYFFQHRSHIVECCYCNNYKTFVVGPNDDNNVIKSYNGILKNIYPILGNFSFFNVFALFKFLLKTISKEEKTIIHAISFKPILFVLFFRLFSYFYSKNKNIVYIFTFAGLGHIFSSIARKNLIGFMRYWLIHIIIFIFLRGDHIWTTFETEEDRQTILSISNLSKINAILINGTGVDLNLFYPFYSNKNKPFNVLFAGRMLRSKGIIQYLEVSKILASSDFVFKIAGWEYQSPDALSPSELKLLIDSPTVDFLGFVDDMATLLRSVDAVVLPSSYPEGIPKIFLEAAASGLPIISTDFPGARRVIEDGVTGIIINAPTVEQIADAVLSIYNQPDLGRAMGEKAHRFIHDGNFSEADIQKQFIAVFERAQLGDN